MLVRGHGVGAKSTEHDVGKRISRPPGEPFIAIVCRHRADTRRAGMQGANADLVSSGLKICTALLRSEEHTSELQSLMRISYAVFCLKKKNTIDTRAHLTSSIHRNP